MEEKAKKYCPNCSQTYHLKSPTNPKANIPLFLECGHSMCESCVRNIVKFEEPIECKVCHRDMKVSPGDVALLSINKDKIYDLFPVNLFLLGELTFRLMEETCRPQKQEISCYIDLHAILKNADLTKGECMECHTQTSKMCRQCETVLCDSCFTKTHKNFIIFQNHVLQNIEPKIDTSKCRTHKGKPLDYYCKDCSKAICMDCLVVGGEKSCKNHDVVPMDEVNDTFIEELTNYAPKLDESFRRLSKTAVTIGNLLYNIENEAAGSSDLTQVLANIEQHFSRLSYAIQKHKQEVIDIVVKLKSSEKESLRKAKDEIANALKKTKSTLSALNVSLDTKKNKTINFAVLLDEAKQISESPWYLTKDESNDPLKVAVNEDLCTLVNDYIHLEGNANSVYKLKSTEEIPEGMEVPPAPPSLVYPPELPKDVRMKSSALDNKPAKPPAAAPVFSKNGPKYRSKSGSVSSVNSADSESSIRNAFATYGEMYAKPVVHQVQPFAESQHPKQLHEGSQELIYISHIVNPHNFYVQRACHQGLVKEMLREFKGAKNLPKPAIKHVAEGKTYLVFNKTDNLWQRCRVMSIDRRDPENPLFHVFCIDFGSSEIANIDKLRLLPPARVQSPFPLAINCSLANCRPRTGAWSVEDAYLISNIIDNKQAIIHVRQIRATSDCTVTLDCDVITFEEGISLAHALVFHERAVLMNPKLSYPKIIGIMQKPKLFLSNSDFKHKSTEEVYITHIVSPDKFYVRKRHLEEVYLKLCDDLDQEYSLAVTAGSVYLPELGMVCVAYANIEDEGSRADCGAHWHRAVVRGLPGRGRAELLLPDTGHHLLLHWTHLRHIAPKFCTHAALATECHLAGVTPVHKKWSPGSVALLRQFAGRPLELHVEDARRGSIGVTLVDYTDPDNVVCVNTEMIKYKFAITFGLFMFNKNADIEDQVKTNRSPLDPPKVHAKPKGQEIKMLTKNNAAVIAKKIKDEDLEAKDKGPLRLEAKILNYQSPSLIYVSLVHQQKVFKELFEKMQKYYANNATTKEKKDWTVGDRCATLCDQSKTWRRAVIIELENSNAKVFYSDFAVIETVPMSSLKELTQEFMVIGDAAIKCHLSGVMSADGEDWPTITKEFLKELLDAYPRVFITKLGNFKDKSMPVEVWVYHTIQGGPLEPNKSEWRCLNKKIIEQGLAVPDKSQQISGESHSGVDDDMLALLKNVTGGCVGDYLQLEPIPTTPLVVKQNAKSLKSDSISDDEDSSSSTQDNDGTIFISDWLPPEPLQCKEFTGMPTYIDNNGIIYLHDIIQQDTLELIRKALDVRFKDPEPKAKYTKWNVGEPCVARFFLDNRFYRGRIVEVNNDNSTCMVHYVDYGNEEVCSFEDLRKSLALYQIPIQAHKCVLSRILPAKGTWDRQALDYIHKFIVEKQCFIKVTDEARDGVIPIDLKYDKIWINEHLVEFDLAVYADGSKPIVPKYLPIAKETTNNVEPIVTENDSGPDYIVEDENNSTNESFNMKSLEGMDWIKLMDEDEENDEERFITFPKFNEKTFLCNISIINDLKKLDLSIIHDDETNKLYEIMFEEIQRESEKLPKLKGVFENKACVALFHEDEQWYRAVILQFSEDDGRVKVRYVDYGNIDVIKIDDIREIDENWTHLPPATLTAALHGVQVNPDLEVSIVTKEYVKIFLDKGPFYAKIVNEGDPLPTVELHNNKKELLYADLIKNNILLEYSDSNLVD